MPRDFPVPAPMRERALEWLAAELPVVVAPRAAATVVLVRPGPTGVEVFLMRRRTTMAFAAGMAVFPGGGVDPRDGDADVPWAGPPAATWAADLGVGEARARAVVCAAVRETFEECGVLLASRPDQLGSADVVDVDDGDVAAPGWEVDRRRLLGRDVALSGLLTERGVVLRSDLLRPWAHWTTPPFETRRYDTWFLLARLPAGRRARHVSSEASEAGWWPAADVLDAVADGRLGLLPPTLVTVEELAAAADVDALWRADRSLAEIEPVLVRDDDAVVLRADLQ